MKEVKEFIQELYDSATSGCTGMLVPSMLLPELCLRRLLLV